MRSCAEHEFITYVNQDDAFYSYPIHENDIRKMPDFIQIEKERKNTKGPLDAKNLEEYWINCAGKTIFSKFIEGYNKKMWLLDNLKELPSEKSKTFPTLSVYLKETFSPP